VHRGRWLWPPCEASDMADIKDVFKEKICVISNQRMTSVLRGLDFAMSDKDLAAKLQAAFVAAAGGNESKAAEIMFELPCTLIELYPNPEQLKQYLFSFYIKYPSLAAVIAQHVQPFTEGYLR